jgi:hypothetical protein
LTATSVHDFKQTKRNIRAANNTSNNTNTQFNNATAMIESIHASRPIERTTYTERGLLKEQRQRKSFDSDSTSTASTTTSIVDRIMARFFPKNSSASSSAARIQFKAALK